MQSARFFPPRHFTNMIFYDTIYKFHEKRAPHAEHPHEKRVPQPSNPRCYCCRLSVRAPKTNPAAKRNKTRKKPKQNGKHKGDPR